MLPIPIEPHWPMSTKQQKQSNPANRSFGIDGKLLVVRTGSVLPPLCVKTGAKVAKGEYSKRRLKWTQETRGRKLVMIISYFTSRQNCELTFGLSTGQKTKLLMFFIFN